MSAGGVSAQLDLAAIEARLKKAVRGPWRHDVDPRPDGADQIITAGGLAWITVAFMPTPAEKFYDTAQFIAHAPSDVAVLVEAVKALRAALTQLRVAHHRMDDAWVDGNETTLTLARFALQEADERAAAVLGTP